MKKNDFSIMDIFAMLSRHIALIVITVIIFVLAAFIKCQFFSPPVYSANGSLYISNLSKNDSSDIGYQQKEVTLSELMTSQELIKSYIQILSTDRFFNRVKTISNLKYSVASLKSMVTFEALNQTEILNISVVAPNPHDAYIIVETIISIAKDEIEWVVEGGSLKTLDYPSYSSSPLPNNTTVTMMIAAFIALVLSAALILVIEMLDTRIKGRDDLLSSYDIYILGEVPSFNSESAN